VGRDPVARRAGVVAKLQQARGQGPGGEGWTTGVVNDSVLPSVIITRLAVHEIERSQVAGQLSPNIRIVRSLPLIKLVGVGLTEDIGRRLDIVVHGHSRWEVNRHPDRCARSYPA